VLTTPQNELLNLKWAFKQLKITSWREKILISLLFKFVSFIISIMNKRSKKNIYLTIFENSSSKKGVKDTIPVWRHMASFSNLAADLSSSRNIEEILERYVDYYQEMRLMILKKIYQKDKKTIKTVPFSTKSSD
jgi:hypothetical protein